jgi:hypothetical protein
MAHINIKNQPDAESAILQVTALEKWSRHWEWGGASFGQTIHDRRAIDAAIKAKNKAAFKALQRRGYWRVELA